MKKLLAFLTVGFLLMFLVGCSSNTTTTDTTDTTDEDTEMSEVTDKDFYGSWEGSTETKEGDAEVTTQIALTFNDDGTYSQKDIANVPDEFDQTDYMYTGTYKIDTDKETVTFNVEKVNDKIKDEFIADNSEATDEEVEKVFEEKTYKYEFKSADELNLTDSSTDMMIEFKKMDEE